MLTKAHKFEQCLRSDPMGPMELKEFVCGVLLLLRIRRPYGKHSLWNPQLATNSTDAPQNRQNACPRGVRINCFSEILASNWAWIRQSSSEALVSEPGFLQLAHLLVKPIKIHIKSYAHPTTKLQQMRTMYSDEFPHPQHAFTFHMHSTHVQQQIRDISQQLCSGHCQETVRLSVRFGPLIA